MSPSLGEIAKFIGAELLGPEEIEIRAIASLESSVEGDLVFVEDEKRLRLALGSRAAAIIAGNFAADEHPAKPLLICAQPRLGFARAAEYLALAPAPVASIHPSAVVDPSARLGRGVAIAAHAVVGEGVEVGEGSSLGAGCVLAAGVRLGKHCRLYPRVTIYAGTRLGDRVIVHSGAVLGSDGFGYVKDRATGRHQKFPQVGTLEIADDVEIGANTTIDRGSLEATRIGRGTKIDNLVHVGHNCQVGEDVILAAQTGLSGSIVLGNRVVLGGQVGIGEHARIEPGVMLGGQGGVLPHKTLRGDGVAFWGTPAKPVREYLKQLAALARLSRRK
jgi:UDP-3-O-[3-hydroxymyristoyl] glucosamine N-acyltransferase